MVCDRMAISRVTSVFWKLSDACFGGMADPSGFRRGVHSTRLKIVGRELRKRKSDTGLRTPATQIVFTPGAIEEILKAQGFRGRMTGGNRCDHRQPVGGRSHPVALAPVTRVQESKHGSEPVLGSWLSVGGRSLVRPAPRHTLCAQHHCVRGFQPLISLRTMMA